MITKTNKCFQISATLSQLFTHMMQIKQTILQNTLKTLKVEMGEYLKELDYDA